MAKETLLGVNNVAHNVPKIYIGDNNALARNVRRAYLGIGDIAMRVFERYHINYVSLGDSIAAGHMINGNWERDYGIGSQYGQNGNKETVIVPGSYTDIFRKELETIYGDSHVSVKSFAESGDTVKDLLEKLSHKTVIDAIEDADLVTICIGANDVLAPAMNNLGNYIETGDFSAVENTVKENLAILNDDTSEYSYKALFDRLNEINPNAKYLFTTIYNPYKYLQLEKGSYGLIASLLGTIPNGYIDVDEIVEEIFNIGNLVYWDVLKWEWASIELSINLGFVGDGLANFPAVQTLFDRVNAIGNYTEMLVEGGEDFEGLNRILRKKIDEYQAINPNFAVAETKMLFDLFPNTTTSVADVDYADLLNVRLTRNFNEDMLNWGALWEGSDAWTFWYNLAMKHLSFKNASPSLNVWDYVSFDGNAFAEELVSLIAEKVIIPDVDPHPKAKGHEVLKRSFTNMLGLVQYESNGGSYVADEFVLAGKKPTLAVPVREGSEFVAWYKYTDDFTKQEVVDPNSTDYTDYNANITLSDLVLANSIKSKFVRRTMLYADWNIVILLQLGNNEYAKFFIETEDGVFSIDNIVDLEGELSNGKFIIDLV